MSKVGASKPTGIIQPVTHTHIPEALNHNNCYLFLRYNQQDVSFLSLFTSIVLYMFRVEPPPIIRSSDCTYSFWYLSNHAATCCNHGWDRTKQTWNMHSVIEINKMRKMTSCWLYLRNISEDACTYECQSCYVCQYSMRSKGKLRLLNIAVIYAAE
jgi:hypothetical protein